MTETRAPYDANDQGSGAAQLARLITLCDTAMQGIAEAWVTQLLAERFDRGFDIRPLVKRHEVLSLRLYAAIKLAVEDEVALIREALAE